MNSRVPSPELIEAPIILDRSRHSISRADIDTDALKVLYRLYKKGHTAYLVGGAVRDLLLGRIPADFDVSTDARPNRIKKLFANAFLIGRRFRLAHIRFQGGKIIEVSTFRKKPEEGSELDQQPGKNQETGKETDDKAPPAEAKRIRKPIAFGTPREDAFRRDITINALFYDIATFSVIDYVGGLEDLKARRIRIIGDPDVSYVEDPVRIWRVLRHAARLDFSIEERTEEAIPRHRHLLSASPGSRLFEELSKDMKTGAAGPFFELMHRNGILPIILGEIGEFYEKERDHFRRLKGLLDLIDSSSREGQALSPRMVYSLFFWPWAAPLLAGAEGDKPHILYEAERKAGTAVLFPKGLLLDVFQVLVIADEMIRALSSGRMRWSLKKRAQYADASRICSFLVQGKAGEGQDPFEQMMAERFPGVTRRRKRRRRPQKQNP